MITSPRHGHKVTHTHLAVGEVIDLLADVGDVRFGFIVGSATGNVTVGFGQTQDGALQTDKDRVGQRGVVCLRVIVHYLIHPALSEDIT